jgi:hypothetical protein
MFIIFSFLRTLVGSTLGLRWGRDSSKREMRKASRSDKSRARKVGFAIF